MFKKQKMSNLLYVHDSLNNRYLPPAANPSGNLQVEISNAAVNCNSTIMNASIPVTYSITVAGSQANGFTGSVLDGATSTGVDVSTKSVVTVMGNSDVIAGNIMVQYSEDNANYYTAFHLAPDYKGDFHVSQATAAKYVRLESAIGSTANIEATILSQN
jgi:hypothetical protein